MWILYFVYIITELPNTFRGNALLSNALVTTLDVAFNGIFRETRIFTVYAMKEIEKAIFLQLNWHREVDPVLLCHWPAK